MRRLMRYLKVVGAVSLAINHVQHFILDAASLTVAVCPIVSGTTTVGGQVNVFGVVEGSKGRLQNAADNLYK